MILRGSDLLINESGPWRRNLQSVVGGQQRLDNQFREEQGWKSTKGSMT